MNKTLPRPKSKPLPQEEPEPLGVRTPVSWLLQHGGGIIEEGIYSPQRQQSLLSTLRAHRATTLESLAVNSLLADVGEPITRAARLTRIRVIAANLRAAQSSTFAGHGVIYWICIRVIDVAFSPRCR